MNFLFFFNALHVMPARTSDEKCTS